MTLLEVKNLRVVLAEDNVEILKGLNLTIGNGELHVIMGPNGSGKSTLANVLMGNPKYKITSGTVKFMNKNLSRLTVDERARMGMFMTFQHPQEIPGIRFRSFLLSVSQSTGSREPLLKMSKEIDRLSVELGLESELIDRYLNVGFSGGEKKKAEIVQMNFMKPKFAILDEIDSGLDVDAMKSIALSINGFRNSENSVLLITHYQRLLEYVEPDHVHVLIDGSIPVSGGKELAGEVEENGYEGIFGSLKGA
ncbi:MAG TPA: Fe-S cluster assembly ATPase SufC [Mesotoga infera]|uniref:Fe-S cluster assembly ATPase SufC n=1 Tax=Mesotoga infera TaxID=1236046 RepID=A0A7C1GSZ2_9BACT|nr:Fe-S cluster assembly ATPase SufC [Mesotoga infera]